MKQLTHWSEKMFNRLTLLISLSFVIISCTPSTNFYWGSYEETLFEKYRSSGGISPEEELRRMFLDVEKAQSEGLKIAPGINLHIAMLYSQLGNIDAAKDFVRAEETLYPQSALFTQSVFKKLK